MNGMQKDDGGIELVDAAKRRALSAIEKVWDSYYDPTHGLKLREEQAAVAGAKISSYIYGVAQFAWENRPRKYQPHDVFAAMCSYAESKLKAKHSVDNLKEALPCWATYKTTILSGLRAGLNPLEYKTEWEFRKAGMETRVSLTETKELVPQDGVTEHATTQGVTKLPTKLRIEPTRRFFRATSIASSLKLLLAQLVVEANYIRKGCEDEAEAIVREAQERLARLVDKGKIKDPATKLAIEADTSGETGRKRRVA